MKRPLSISIIGAIALILPTWSPLAQAVPFAPPADNPAPRRTMGGASRGNFGFVPPSDNPAPQRAAGGASRGSFFTPPADNPAPRRTAGGAARGEDAADETSRVTMMGLMPQSSYGTTLSNHPTILVYLPASNAQEAIFSLKDEDRNMVYTVNATISGEAGVYAFQIPADAPSLAVGQNYQWFVALKLDDDLTPGSPFVDGWIKRVEASQQLAASLDQGDALAQASALGSAGIWYDSVATLADLRKSQPESEAIAAHWKELLDSVGLQDLVSAPLIVGGSAHP